MSSVEIGEFAVGIVAVLFLGFAQREGRLRDRARWVCEEPEQRLAPLGAPRSLRLRSPPRGQALRIGHRGRSSALAHGHQPTTQPGGCLPRRRVRGAPGALIPAQGFRQRQSRTRLPGLPPCCLRRDGLAGSCGGASLPRGPAPCCRSPSPLSAGERLSDTCVFTGGRGSPQCGHGSFGPRSSIVTRSSMSTVPQGSCSDMNTEAWTTVDDAGSFSPRLACPGLRRPMKARTRVDRPGFFPCLARPGLSPSRSSERRLLSPAIASLPYTLPADCTGAPPRNRHPQIW